MKKRLLLVLGLLVALSLIAAVPVSAKGPKVDVCHYDADTATFHLIRISEKAVSKHITNHGDALPGDPVPELVGFVFDEACGIVPEEIPETLFAVAYTDIDPSDGGYDPDVDVLISQLVDTNNDGVVSIGDTIEMGQYPKNFNPSFPTDFGSFAVMSHTVDGVIVANSTEVAVLSGADPFDFISSPDSEQYWEGRQFDCHGYSQLLDAKGSTPFQHVTMNGYGAGEGCESPLPESPSLPDMTIMLDDFTGSTADEYFVDVDIMLP